MLKIQHLIVCLILSIALSSCQVASEREAHRAEALLTEAELQLDLRKLDKAEELTEQALGKLAPLIEKQPKHIDFRLLRVRAYIAQFLAQNMLVLEEAPIRPRSLVRFPEAHNLINYQDTLQLAHEELRDLANNPEELDFDQTAFVHGNLALILRLNESTLEDALKEYERAIAAYQTDLDGLKADVTKIGSHKIKIAQLENQVRSLRLAQSEVSLLSENWEQALNYLQSAMAGRDLKYFDVQFSLLNEQIEQAENKLEEIKKLSEGSREAKLLQLVEAKKAKRYSKREEISGYNPYKISLLQSKIELADTQNNLMYRIICYYNLGDDSRQQRAEAILRTHFPEIESHLNDQLQSQ